MLTIDKNYSYITRHDDHYSVDTIMSSDSVTIELDKPLVVQGNVNICGFLFCEDLSINGSAIISEGLAGNAVSAESIVVKGSTIISESLYTKDLMRLGPSQLKGTILSDRNIQILGQADIEGNIGAGQILDLRGDVVAQGRVMAGLVATIRNTFSVDGDMKIHGEIVDKYTMSTGVGASIVVYSSGDNTRFVVIEREAITRRYETLKDLEQAAKSGSEALKEAKKQAEIIAATVLPALRPV